MNTIPNEGIPSSYNPEFRKLFQLYLPYELARRDVDLLEAHGFLMYWWNEPEEDTMGFRIDADDGKHATTFHVTRSSLWPKTPEEYREGSKPGAYFDLTTNFPNHTVALWQPAIDGVSELIARIRSVREN